LPWGVGACHSGQQTIPHKTVVEMARERECDLDLKIQKNALEMVHTLEKKMELNRNSDLRTQDRFHYNRNYQNIDNGFFGGMHRGQGFRQNHKFVASHDQFAGNVDFFEGSRDAGKISTASYGQDQNRGNFGNNGPKFYSGQKNFGSEKMSLGGTDSGLGSKYGAEG
jgi:hypothetical protein